ncbi:hypothetical protein RND71_030308 [Anisodus tanguticus]|uniref:Reverse transcriptase n=1 Tax=Anisodus tanguticus TaxID=243964 RepID=A0AAE1V825_9SOLA|nr:hypothetical protein RND71_030308 [Anisodus tanguticus]
MLVKSRVAETHLTSMVETFDIMRRHDMKLNLKKCAFGVRSGKFLGFLISNRGIEMNPDKFKTIHEMMNVLNSIKMVQRLTGKVVALGRFISRSTDQGHEFFKLTKKDHRFQWTQECD